jgi:hypothetical protein
MENRSSKIILRNLTSDQKKGILAGTITIGSILAGGSLFGFKGHDGAKISENVNSGSTPESVTDNSETLVVSTTSKFHDVNNDHLSFDDAFAAARQKLGQGGFFNWKNDTYNTFHEDEWKNMSESEKNKYLDEVQNSMDTKNVLENRHPDGKVMQPSKDDTSPSEDDTPPSEDGTPPSEEVIPPSEDDETTQPKGEEVQPDGDGPKQPDGDIEPIPQEFTPDYKVQNGELQEPIDLAPSDVEEIQLDTNFDNSSDLPLEVGSSDVIDAFDMSIVESEIDKNVIEAVDVNEIEMGDVSNTDAGDVSDIELDNHSETTPSEESGDIPNLF